MKQIFTIPGNLPGLNDYTSANRQNRYVGAKIKRQAEDAIIRAVKAARIRPVLQPVKLHYLWIEKARRRDLDNVAFAKKFVQDALVKCGVLAGDGWDNVTGFTDSFDVDKKNPRIIVTIELADIERLDAREGNISSARP